MAASQGSATGHRRHEAGREAIGPVAHLPAHGRYPPRCTAYREPVGRITVARRAAQRVARLCCCVSPTGAKGRAHHLPSRGGQAQRCHATTVGCRQTAERRPAAGLRQHLPAVAKQKRGTAARCHLKRQDRNLYPPHPADFRQGAASAISVARDCIDRADAPTAAAGVWITPGHLPFQVF